MKLERLRSHEGGGSRSWRGGQVTLLLFFWGHNTDLGNRQEAENMDFVWAKRNCWG